VKDYEVVFTHWTHSKKRSKREVLGQSVVMREVRCRS